MFPSCKGGILGELAKSARVIARRGVAALGILLAWTASAGSQTIREDYPLPNGLIHALATAGGTLYVGGSFTRIGPRAFFGAVLSPAAGEIVHVPKLDGWVGSAAPDGQGGWFIIGGRQITPWPIPMREVLPATKARKVSGALICA